MAGRGFGRGGRGFGRGMGHPRAPQKPVELFPKLEVGLPDKEVFDIESKSAIQLVLGSVRLRNYWSSSPYYLEETSSKEQSTDIERFCDRGKPKTTGKRDSITQFLQLNSQNFPRELIGGSNRERPSKRVRWNPDTDLQKLDLLEQMEQKNEGQEKGEKEKKEGEDEGDDDEDAQEAEEEFSDDGDYNQNFDFDDDEDDFNMDDRGDDEPFY
ncbi:DNA-directed RNA polymerase III subunit RPC7-like isoform X2 [Tripterygium wilfordii]|uniref:DNA-directed RNA polymerase III subunit RPC7-like isoform X2 n=1 Tax=Tripterygium wilfordii TaxID=458696 RepID=UPI0018F860C6|nr:DNA-directed RNA polymerase III subunit RPC7-like isoform X2 [Tripterygium wilfordii]